MPRSAKWYLILSYIFRKRKKTILIISCYIFCLWVAGPKGDTFQQQESLSVYTWIIRSTWCGTGPHACRNPMKTTRTCIWLLKTYLKYSYFTQLLLSRLRLIWQCCCFAVPELPDDTSFVNHVHGYSVARGVMMMSEALRKVHFLKQSYRSCWLMSRTLQIWFLNANVVNLH